MANLILAQARSASGSARQPQHHRSQLLALRQLTLGLPQNWRYLEKPEVGRFIMGRQSHSF
ncbi:hypothetical protein EN829_019130 [Mesorhizobium sp. M00.F.Ca.ET.186.01.1.1]|nr:hypothetical protein EN829_019130 [Mesorhizobium sp. M00.F.Ca.ET.186.01.1.1]